MQKPKISIIMPVYNSEAYMEKSINSILNQTLKELELICINDTSKDNSLKVLQKISKKDKRLIILDNQKNLGPGGSRNMAILIAKGEFVMFVDSDDWLETDACEKLYNLATSEKSDFVYIRPKIIYENKTILDKRLFRGDEIKNKETVFKKSLRRKIAWAPWTKMIKRNLITKNNILFPQIHIAEDMVFSVKVLHFAKRISECREYLYNYLMREGSLMSYKNSQRRIENYLESIKLIRDFMNKNNIFQKYQKDFIYFKFYTYLAIYGVMHHTKEKIDKRKYGQIIENDTDFRMVKILSLGTIDSVILGIILIKLHLFNGVFFIREKIRQFKKIGRKR